MSAMYRPQIKAMQYFIVVPSIVGLRLMEMEKAAKEAEAAHIPGGVWVWLPDRRCLVDQHVAAIYGAKNPLPESLQPPCDSPPQGFIESFEGASPVVFRGSFKRSLSQGDIQERQSSCSQEIFSPSLRIATPETPSAGAFKRKRSERVRRQFATRSDIKVHPERDGEDPANDPCAHCEHMICVCVQCK